MERTLNIDKYLRDLEVKNKKKYDYAIRPNYILVIYKMDGINKEEVYVGRMNNLQSNYIFFVDFPKNNIRIIINFFM
jgi:hypothetical protein